MSYVAVIFESGEPQITLRRATPWTQVDADALPQGQELHVEGGPVLVPTPPSPPDPVQATADLLDGWDSGRRSAYSLGRGAAMVGLSCHGLSQSAVLLAGTQFVDTLGSAVANYRSGGSKKALLAAIEALPVAGDFAWLGWEMATPTALPIAPQQPAPEGAETIQGMLLRVLSSVP